MEQHNRNRAPADRVTAGRKTTGWLVNGSRVTVVELEACAAVAEDVGVVEAVEGLHAVLAVEGGEPVAGVGAEGGSTGYGGRRNGGDGGVSVQESVVWCWGRGD